MCKQTTVGTKPTMIHPESGFAVDLPAAAVIMAALIGGLPVCSTPTPIGVIIGVGLAKRSASWKLLKPIAMTGNNTPPAASSIGVISVLVLRTLFG